MSEEKTYTTKLHFKITIEGDYACGNMLEEELLPYPEDWCDTVWNWVADNMIDYYGEEKTKIEISNCEIIEEES